MATYSGILVLLEVIYYVGAVVTLQKWFEAIGVQPSWGAWIPIFNNYLMFKGGDKAWWWIILLFIPFVNIVAFIVLIMAYITMWKKAPDFAIKNFLWVLIGTIVIVAYTFIAGPHMAGSFDPSALPSPSAS